MPKPFDGLSEANVSPTPQPISRIVLSVGIKNDRYFKSWL